MSEFSKLIENADEDVKHIAVTENKTNDIQSLDNSHTEAEIVRDHLDEIEERNAVTIELLKDVDVATESRDLTPAEFNILKTSLRAITNSRVLKDVAMESSEGANLRPIAMEGIKDTLKKFWVFIKEQVKKFWTMLKQWWIKCFDISKRLKKRADNLIKEADDQYGSASENTMDFPEISKLAIAGKYNDPTAIVHGLKSLEDITADFINDNTSERFNETVEELSDKTTRVIENIYSEAKDVLSQVPDQRIERDRIYISKDDITSIKTTLSKILTTADNDFIKDASFASTGNEDKFKKLHGIESDKDRFTRSVNLPGDKWVLSVQPELATLSNTNLSNLPDIIDYVRRSKLTIGSCFYNAKKYDSGLEVRVLNPSLISRGCESVSKICEYVFEYRQAFEKRDKFKERVIKDIDRLINEVTDEHENAYQEVDRTTRTFANSMVGLIRRRSDFETSLCSYAIATGVAFANYSEKSLKLYSK